MAISGIPDFSLISSPSIMLYLLMINPSSIIQFTSLLFNDLTMDKIFCVESLPLIVTLPKTTPSMIRSRRITTPATVELDLDALKLSATPNTRIPLFSACIFVHRHLRFEDKMDFLRSSSEQSVLQLGDLRRQILTSIMQLSHCKNETRSLKIE